MDFNLEIQGCIEGVVRGFRRSIVENQPRYYKAWTPKNSNGLPREMEGQAPRVLI